MRPYADLFVDPKGPGDIRPTALKVAQDAGVIGQWAGKVVLITGATSGIGIETARTLFATGADIYITARSLKKGEDAVKEIINGSQGKGTIGIIEMDLTSLDSVKKAVESFLAKSDKLNILINNAGKNVCKPLRG
jgi:NAD(P)-dependent dehydrogenase (short-subunit alcohol dehydrogenase family)